jgi:2-oxoglutarate ferredoxin oxidoreductase subunit beta
VSTTANPPKKTNRIGLEVLNYRGGKTTLCAGCGHNSISERIVEVFFEMGIQPWNRRRTF